MKRSLLIGTTILVLALAACGSDDDKDKAKADDADKTKTEEAKPDKHLICPQVAIIRELETVRDFGNEKPEPAQLVSAGHMKSLDGDCAYHKDQDEDQTAGIDIGFTLEMVAAKGPKLGGDRVEYPFFVAVVDPDGKILNKDQMSVVFKFKEGEQLADHEEKLHVFIPLVKEKQDAGPRYRVLTGFQLTEDQLRIVRENEARPVPTTTGAPPTQ